MNRLTDRRTAQQVKENAEGLLKKGFAPAVSDQIYIKLAEYENAEEEATMMFLCDASKNNYCTKENCRINGGECYQTHRIECRIRK